MARTRPGVAVTIDVLANDSDPDDDLLSIELPAPNASATFSILADALVVTPAPGYLGTLVFSYRVRDEAGALSPPANVSVVVGFDTRAIVRMGSMAGTRTRFSMAGTAQGEGRDILTLGNCTSGGSPLAIANGGRRIIAQRCSATSATRSDITLADARAATLADPVVVHATAALGPGIALAGSTEVLLTERVVSPDDLSVPGAYDLVSFDIAQRTVVRRYALPGIQRVLGLRKNGAGTRRVLLTVIDAAGDSALFLADPDVDLLQRLSGPGPLPTHADTTAQSPEGRFFVIQPIVGTSIEGYDQQAPGMLRSLWTYPGAGPTTFITQIQFSQLFGATLLVQVTDPVASESAIWSVPLATPANAREVARFPATTLARRFLVFGSRLIYPEDAGGGRVHIRSREFQSNTAVTTLSPPSGIVLNSFEQYTGNVLLLTYEDDQQRSRGGLIRVETPGVLLAVAPDLEIPPSSMTIDATESTIGFVHAPANQPRRSYVADVNLLTAPVPLQDGRAAGEDAMHVFVLGPPLP
jgi:hypothetical protein